MQLEMAKQREELNKELEEELKLELEVFTISIGGSRGDIWHTIFLKSGHFPEAVPHPTGNPQSATSQPHLI